ncbi:FG-GAP-like repeat-containing protein [Myxococcota bacterium]|nr:FG-GAP-like repeat-containing protein [Myxococcota bacterium]
MKRKYRWGRVGLGLLGVWALGLLLTAADWPNGPDEDPTLAIPNDPDYARRCRCKAGATCPDEDPDTKENKDKPCFHDRQCGGKSFVCQGRGYWNYWSFVPEEWTKTPGFREEEKQLGTGIHADRAWQLTTGDARVLIAVTDSGVYWDNKDLVNKYYLNTGELPKPQDKDGKEYPTHDANGDGVVNMLDYADDPRVTDKNGNGIKDPGDLIKTFSNGKDDDNNGYIDDISGWDFMQDDNDPNDDTRFGHGNGEASDSAAEGNNGISGVGVCPKCMVMMLRVSDSFVGDTNHFAAASIYAADMGAQVIQDALGVMNNTPYSREAVAYAWRKGTLVIGSSADETSYHHNYPGIYLHTLYVSAIRYDAEKVEQSKTFLNFTNCSNFGGKLVISTPGVSCSSEATGISSGHAGLLYAAGLKFKVTPPLNAAETYQLFIMSADDINVAESKTDKTKYPSGPGWDHYFGYGRNNARRSVEWVRDGAIPPTALITSPRWFQPIYPAKTPSIAIEAEIEARRHERFDYILEVAKGVQPEEGAYRKLKEEKSVTQAIKGKVADWSVKDEDYEKTGATTRDAHKHSYTIRIRVTAYRKDGKTDKGEFRKTVHLLDDPDLVAAFPMYLDAGGAPSLKMADLNNDGKQELIVASESGTIHAFDINGKDIEGWPVQTKLLAFFDPNNPNNHLKAPAYDKEGFRKDYRQSIIATPAIGDLDGDGKLEVVVASYDGEVYVFGHDGKPKAGFPVKLDAEKSKKTDKNNRLEYGIFASPVLFDLDGDGKLEIIVGAMDGHIYVWRHDGSMQPGFPVELSDKSEATPQRGRIMSTPAVGDVDGDGKPEIFVGTNEVYKDEKEARLYGIHHDGNNHAGGPYLAGWPVKIFTLAGDVLPYVGRGNPNSPMLADFDGDGKLEIVNGTMFFSPTIYKADGTQFRQMLPAPFGAGTDSTDTQMIFGLNNPSLGDLDGDGIPDLIGGGVGGNALKAIAGPGGVRADAEHLLGAWSGKTGRMLAGFPRVVEDFQFFMNPVVAEISGDDKYDVISGTGGYLLHAVGSDGKPVAGYPKQTGGWLAASPTSGDMDGDGKRELAALTRNGWLFVWRTKGDAGIKAQWESFHHDLANTGNFSVPLPGRRIGDAPEKVDEPNPSDGGNTDKTGPATGCGCQSSGESGFSVGLLLILLCWLARRRVVGVG